MQESLTEELNKSAAEAHAAFPEKLKNLIVINASSKTLIYAASEITDHLSKNPTDIKEAIEYTIDYMHLKKFNSLAIHNYPLAGTIVKLITINENPEDVYSPQFTKKMKAIAYFNHEIGHIVVENGHSNLGPKHLSECAANAYTALQQIRLFGKNTGFFKHYNRAHLIVSNTSRIHYTDDVIQKVKQLSEEMDISALSLNKIAELAEKIALENHLDDKTLKKISAAFSPAANAYKRAGKKWNDNALKKCMEVIWRYMDDPDILKAGIRFLNRPDIKKRLESNAKTDIYWKEALDFIKNHSTESTNKGSEPKPLKKKSPEQTFQASL